MMHVAAGSRIRIMHGRLEQQMTAVSERTLKRIRPKQTGVAKCPGRLITPIMPP